ncbi:MAG: tRNA pseudouridine(13) synthase TruD [Campylobacterota bacterium]|nr:tRNA pseudouridine(13) synthase TruD [Campylobacterota bacterium]
MDRLYFLDHASIPFHFRQAARDFVVEEVPLYEFSGEGEHLVLHVRKKDLTTWDMVSAIAKHLGIKEREIGYAGLKDKNAMTKQYISLLKIHEEKLATFSHEKIKILAHFYHGNKIRIGHLKANRFFIRLKKVTPVAAEMIAQVLSNIKRDGVPNYFGYQRFGIGGDNYKKGQGIVEKTLKERNKKLRTMYISAYQSHQFNLWLSRRIEISKLCNSFETSELTALLNMSEHDIKAMKKQKHPFKLIEGDTMMHYPYGRLFAFEAIDEEIARFDARQVSPTGLLSGKRVKASIGQARLIEKEFDVEMNEDGARRYAWIFPEDIESHYREEEAWMELHFTLPKGSYATVLIEEIAKRKIKES